MLAKTSQRVSSACQSVCRLAPTHHRLVHRLEERNQVFQAVGDRAQREVQAVRGPVGQESIGRPIEQILIQEQSHPDRDPQDRSWGSARGGGGAVTMPGWAAHEQVGR